MIHYHCSDINPHSKLLDLAGRHLLVSHAYPRSVEVAHQIAQTVLLDNGAFSVWRAGRVADWEGYYSWANKWFKHPTTWAIIPDVIDGGEEVQDALIKQWPYGDRGAPVWHLDEGYDRLLRLTDEWPRVCLGSAGEYNTIGSDKWRRRMDLVFNMVSSRIHPPWLHGLRMQGVTGYPFGSVDSADIARNNNRPQNSIKGMAERWDVRQPTLWTKRSVQQELV
jgi:hypothetical protein